MSDRGACRRCRTASMTAVARVIISHRRITVRTLLVSVAATCLSIVAIGTLFVPVIDTQRQLTETGSLLSHPEIDRRKSLVVENLEQIRPLPSTYDKVTGTPPNQPAKSDVAAWAAGKTGSALGLQPSTSTVGVSSKMKNISSIDERKAGYFKFWSAGVKSITCADQQQSFYVTFARLQDAVIDVHRCTGAKAVGGESIQSVLNQSETFEFYTNFDGCFQLPPPCVNGELLKRHSFRDSKKNPLTNWLAGLTVPDIRANRTAELATGAAEYDQLEKRFTVALTRFDYANMFWVLNDWYNIYLVARFFNQTPEAIRVLHVDAHPRGLLDDTWSTLFGGTAVQLSQLSPGRTKFKNLVWGPSTRFSPFVSTVSTSVLSPPYVDDFHRFVVRRHGLADPDERRLDCSNISILFIWRRDYVAHPRNPAGLVKRKIANEDELIEVLSTRHGKNYTIRGLQFDRLSFTEQLQAIGQTDILIGMHGAGLSHVVFMPRHGALIELIPYAKHGVFNNMHFADLAVWRHLLYRRWINTNLSLENFTTHSTKVPVNVVASLINWTALEMCSADGGAVSRNLSVRALRVRLVQEAKRNFLNSSSSPPPPPLFRPRATNVPGGGLQSDSKKLNEEDSLKLRENHDRWLKALGVKPAKVNSTRLVHEKETDY